jgi:hypothetical protein
MVTLWPTSQQILPIRSFENITSRRKVLDRQHETYYWTGSCSLQGLIHDHPSVHMYTDTRHRALCILSSMYLTLCVYEALYNKRSVYLMLCVEIVLFNALCIQSSMY